MTRFNCSKLRKPVQEPPYTLQEIGDDKVKEKFSTVNLVSERQEYFIEMTADFKAKKLAETVPDPETDSNKSNEENKPKVKYQVYSER